MTVEGPVLSILTPAYNEANYLGLMIESLQRQSDPRWELILVDDGSSDGTDVIMSEWSERDDRIRIASKGVRLGKVEAFNTAFRASTGTHICHVGGDDLAGEDMVADRLGALDGSGFRVAFSHFMTIDQQGQITGGPFPRGALGSRSGGNITMSRELAAVLFPIPAGLPSEDIWIGQGCTALVENPVHIRGAHYFYRMHAGNSNPRNKTFTEMSRKMHDRAQATRALLEQDRFALSPAARSHLKSLWTAAEQRNNGQLWALATNRDLSVVDRLANLSMAHPLLWRIRQQFPRLLTGWRGK